MKKIKLSQNRYALVDDEDFELVSQFKWTYSKSSKSGRNEYAIRGWYSGGIEGKIHSTRKHHMQFMHHFIFGKPKKGYEVDHVNGNGLDNRRVNLRIGKHRENIANQRKSKANTSGYKGVHRDKERNKWIAQIKYKQRHKFLGRFSTKEKAALAYNQEAKKLFGDFAFLNNV